MEWIVASGKKFIQGDYESYKTEAFMANLQPGDVVIDIGAHVGYFTAIASRKVGEDGKVIAFEPRPLNLRFLKKHVNLNNLRNVRIVPYGVAEISGNRHFDIDTGTGTGHISESGEMKIEVVSLDKEYDGGRIPKPDFLKIDVEGGEVDVLKGSKRVIKSTYPKILVATHGKDTHDFVTGFLKRYGYRLEILNPKAIKGDTEIIAVPEKVKK